MRVFDWLLLLPLSTSLPLLSEELHEHSGEAPTRSRASEFTRLFDTLSVIVTDEYKNRIIAHSDEDLRVDEEIKLRNESVNIAGVNENKTISGELFQGDIRISVAQLEKIIDGLMNEEGEGSGEEGIVEEGSGEEETLKIRRKRETIKGVDVKWTDGVPYSFHPFLSLTARAIIQEAIDFWQRETCIEFRPRLFESQYLYFLAADGCWSTVGKDALQGQQWISIDSGCEEYGVISHEIGHALGLFHEQSRYDRDNHINLDPLRVQLGYIFQFSKIPPSQLSTQGLPYDVGSIMHYAPSEFSAARFLPALSTRDPFLQQSMGQLAGPSFLDVAILNLHYNCRSRCPIKIHCSNKGYQDPRDCTKCKCPSGFGGVDCRDVETPSILKCGGTLNATLGLRQLTVNIKPNLLRKTERKCIYHIVAPPNSEKIEITMMTIDATCQYGCWKEAMEVKTQFDPRPTGYRFCCIRQLGTTVISTRRRVPLMVYSRGRQSRIVVHYRYVKKEGSGSAENWSGERVNGTMGSSRGSSEETSREEQWNGDRAVVALLRNGSDVDEMVHIRKKRETSSMFEEGEEFTMEDGPV